MANYNEAAETPKQYIRLQFASPIRQDSETSVVIEVATADFAVLTPEYLEHLDRILGAKEAERFTTALRDDIIRREIIATII